MKIVNRKGRVMDSKNIGNIISKLRKKNGMTQCELARQLSVTDKAVSRWENGQGFPDITIFPRLAELFGVSIDYLMLGDKKGITVAGNMILDIVKDIAEYPECGMLSYMSDVSYAVGGCAPNTAIDLAQIDPTIPISVIGKVGTDENGRFILSRLQQSGINVSKVSYSFNTPTSFCDVMNIPSGERTFFHQKGANAEFGIDDIDVTSLNCDILHIGYILLLDRFDAEDKEYGTVMARFLHKVQKLGIKTSIDMVSHTHADYGKKLIPVLKYCNYVIINDIECCAIWNMHSRREDGSLIRENLICAMEKTIDAGVQDRVLIHCKERCFAMDTAKKLTEVPSLNIPKEQIKGRVGAGDAFSAGCLYGIYNNYDDQPLLEFASAAAACNLFAANSVDGMKPKHDILQIAEKYGRLS